ncbi:MAG: 4-alpha-glucanotransferase [Gammaproteobacteria bacterium]
MSSPTSILNGRRAGVLLHITSLPGPLQCGDIGKDAYAFINFLKYAGITVWQMLPLGPPNGDGSPYQCLSAYAGNTALIDIDWLVAKGWLNSFEMLYGRPDLGAAKRHCIAEALLYFEAQASDAEQRDFAEFCMQKAHWLDDYALFLALKQEFGQKQWSEWPVHFRDRHKNSISAARQRLAAHIKVTQFEQYVFFRQWYELKDYASRNGVLLFGDIPIFVAYDSADVWAQRQYFNLDKQGAMLTVAGVPPDYFSETGQRWGNPHYNWAALEKTGFDWWLERIKTQLELFDMLRIDHFRGLEAAWEIPADEPTAIHGRWVTAPGDKLLRQVYEKLGSVPLIAEDLGVITPEVEALRDCFNLPGMKILQFAFDSNPNNPYLPYNVPKNSVIYTGTHDNDTTLGWFQKLPAHQQHFLAEFLGCEPLLMPTALVHAALASVAYLAVIPMQDVLELDSRHRMNIPGVVEGNWRWRFTWEQLTEKRASKLRHMVRIFGRAPEN